MQIKMRKEKGRKNKCGAVPKALMAWGKGQEDVSEEVLVCSPNLTGSSCNSQKWLITAIGSLEILHAPLPRQHLTREPRVL